MGALAVPMMIGAGVGGGLNLLRGKSLGGILQGAALGGAGGALTGGIGSAFGGATGGTAGGAASGVAPATAAEFEAAMGLPSSALVGAGAPLASAMPTGAGMVFNPSTGTYLNPEYYVGASTPMATFTGGEGVLSNAMGNIGASIPQSVKDYATPQNLLGVAQLATDQPRQAPLQNIGGQISRGQAPSFVPFNVGQVQGLKRREY